MAANFPDKTREDWADLASKELKGASPDTLNWTTAEGISLKPLYTQADLEGLAHLGSQPGFAPFVRGPRATSGSPRCRPHRWRCCRERSISSSR